MATTMKSCTALDRYMSLSGQAVHDKAAMTLTIEAMDRTPQVNLTIAGVRSRLAPTVFAMKPWIRHAASR